jgi:hypothetical protein
MRMTIDEFEKLFDYFNERKDLRAVFDRYCERDKDVWYVDDIRSFLEQEQEVSNSWINHKET